MSIPALASIREFFFWIGHGADGIQFSIDEIKMGGIGWCYMYVRSRRMGPFLPRKSRHIPHGRYEVAIALTSWVGRASDVFRR